MTDVLIKRELLEQVASEFEHDNDRYMLGRELRKVLDAPRQPDGEGLEVVAWQDADNPLYTTAERRQMHGWATDGYPIVELCRLPDAQRAIAELREECERLRNCLLEVTVRHFSESLKRRSSDKELEQYLSDGIAQLEAERDTLRQQRDKLAGLLREKFPRIDPEDPYPLDEVEHHCEYTLYQERERLHREIDAALAEVKPCQESPRPAAM